MMLPGPTPVPPRVLRAMGTPMINHRGVDFSTLFTEVEAGLKDVFQTNNDLVILPAAGSGGMESAVVNLLSPGDKALFAVMGVFGQRFVDIATGYRVEPLVVEAPWGEAVKPEQIQEKLAADKDHEIKAVFVTHNETSTGVTLDLERVTQVVQEHPAILVVDAVSSLGAIDLKTDAWGIDVVVTGSQKALMVPPGLALVSVSQRAWEVVRENGCCSYYWNWEAYRKLTEKKQTPYTPAVTLWFALREALTMIREEGLKQIFERHALMAEMVRTGARALGLDLLAGDAVASNTITAVRSPAGINVKDLRRCLEAVYGVVVAGGQKKLAGEVFRIGHLGYVFPNDIINVLNALDLCLLDLGHDHEAGAAVKAAGEVLKRRGKEK